MIYRYRQYIYNFRATESTLFFKHTHEFFSFRIRLVVEVR